MGGAIRGKCLPLETAGIARVGADFDDDGNPVADAVTASELSVAA
jgi:hypothetical protein